MNKSQRKKAKAELFKNCKRYLRGELSILSPEIIITQGNEAKKALLSLRDKIIKRIDEFASVMELNNGQVFWLHTYHPNNWSAFNRQRDFDKGNDAARGWIKYSRLIQEFIQNSA
jgi:uracil-DNA glycosylase family 4